LALACAACKFVEMGPLKIVPLRRLHAADGKVGDAQASWYPGWLCRVTD